MTIKTVHLRCVTYILFPFRKLGLRKHLAKCLAHNTKVSYLGSPVPSDGPNRSITHTRIRIRIAMHPPIRTDTLILTVRMVLEYVTTTLNSC